MTSTLILPQREQSRESRRVALLSVLLARVGGGEYLTDDDVKALHRFASDKSIAGYNILVKRCGKVNDTATEQRATAFAKLFAMTDVSGF